MQKLRKAVGAILEAWGGIRLVVDLLGSMDATRKYAHSAYADIVSVPSSRSLTIIVISVGAVLLLYEPIRRFVTSSKTTQEDILSKVGSPPLATSWPEPPHKQSNESQLRPLIIPVRYGKNPLNRHGLLIRNDGEPAFDVSIENAQVGTSTLKFWNDFPGLTKGDGEVLLESYIELSPSNGLSGNGLRDEMIRQAIEAITVDIKYKNANNSWFVTTCKLERDFQYGIRAGYIGQEPLGAARVERDLELSRKPEIPDVPFAKVSLAGTNNAPQVQVTNTGAGAHFYARLEINGPVTGQKRDIFAKWAHTDTVKARIARGDTCRLDIARLDWSRGRETCQWKVIAVRKDHDVVELPALYSSCAVSTPLIRADDIIVAVSIISEPDLENGIQEQPVVLKAFGARL